MTFEFLDYDSKTLKPSAKGLKHLTFEGYISDKRNPEHSQNFRLNTLQSKKFGDITFTDLERGPYECLSTFEAKEDYLLQIVIAGTSTEQGNLNRLLEEGDCIFMKPGESFISKDSNNCRKLMVHMPVGLIHQTALEFEYFIPFDNIAFDSNVKSFPMHGPLFNLLNDILKQNPDQISKRKIFHYEKLIVSEILEVSGYFFNKDLYQNQWSDNSHIRNIYTYITNNITSDISINDLASICKISRKSLYNVLDRELGLTPSSYVRRLKLNKAYYDLKNNIDVRNVTQVALKYGFTNLGRFSSQYREYIGELPSQTLGNCGR
ncbi:AraC family transcriptional regulator [Marinomonas algarum]|uniref:AraC family transcriptional regulator n=1 Tax=Marinomonas algarum TaxID=2883105 RepID=A0A9X1RV15_9GAMM|nr:AraC family transcriptional regulator [Marinomonas algarum]MCB5163044.1 AraC family transcriptional regulator [Marinomonas algarum]